MNQLVNSQAVKSITPDSLSLVDYYKEFSKYSSMVIVLALQEVKTNYAQTYFGLLWSVMRPLITILVFTLIFSLFLHIPTEKPYHLFAFSGMVAWNFFSQIVSTASSSLVFYQNLIKKMYFPKLILPLAKALVAGFDFSVSLLILMVLVIFQGNLIGLHLLWLPVFVLLNVFCGLLISLWIITFSVKQRDLNQIVPSLMGFAIWITPVFYPTTIVPAKFHFLLYANPMAGIIKGYRYALLGEQFPEGPYWLALAFTVILTFFGAWRLIKIEDKIVDYA